MAEQMSRRQKRADGEAGGTYHNLVEVEVTEAIEFISRRVAAAPVIGVVLGSGLGAFADRLGERAEIPFEEIPHLPATHVAGHAGRLCFGTVAGVDVACLQGRLHLYEGHPPERVVFGCRLLAALGCDAVLLTNAAGGIRLDLAPGTFMLIADHLNLTGENPLVGALNPFVDLTNCYDPELMSAARRAASRAGVRLLEGVYAGLKGPSYETPAEIRMLRALGADAVGMSTVLEAIALRHVGVRVGALSCITNYAAGVSERKLSHTDVQDTANRSEEQLVQLLAHWVELAESTRKARSSE